MTGIEVEHDSEKTTLIRYYTYHGWSMKDELVCYYNLSTGYETISKGTRACAAANGVSDIALDLAGYGSAAAALLNSATTVYHAYIEITGTEPVNGSYEDFIQAKLNYDVCTKYTYADLGFGDGYRLGAVTQEVRLIDSDILKYYAGCSGGEEVLTHKEINRIYVTGSFENPAPIAAASIYSPRVERIGAEIYHHPVNF